MMRITTLVAATATFILGFSGSVLSQEQSTQDGDAFASENAIVNTAIPFAIGAREARQELRGAFGWPTFQEGLVEGVYFRFDPDGYARFAPTPRLDSDVFEVICRPGTLNCMGRKGTMGVFLNGQGLLQLQLDDVSDGDTLSIVEGVTVLPLPQRVLQPLDARMETLLGSGGELVVKRGEAEFARFSLTGFSAVTAYLRWITAKQDYGVLPRGWPVPNSNPGATTTSAVDWQAPVRLAQNSGSDTLAVQNTGQQAVANDVAEVRGELNVLRDLLVSRNSQDPIEASATTAAAPVAPQYETQTQASQTAQQIEALQAQAQTLIEEITRLQGGTAGAMMASPSIPQPMTVMQQAVPQPSSTVTLQTQSLLADPSASQPVPQIHSATSIPQPLAPMPGHATSHSTPANVLANPAAPTAATPQNKSVQITAHLDYLMNEIGLDPQTALMLVQAAHSQEQDMSMVEEKPPLQNLGMTEPGNGVVMDILEELRSQLQNDTVSIEENIMPTATMAETQQVSANEFRTLTDYFKSVFAPESHSN